MFAICVVISGVLGGTTNEASCSQKKPTLMSFSVPLGIPLYLGVSLGRGRKSHHDGLMEPQQTMLEEAGSKKTAGLPARCLGRVHALPSPGRLGSPSRRHSPPFPVASARRLHGEWAEVGRLGGKGLHEKRSPGSSS